MTLAKPRDITEYKKWLNDSLGFEISKRTETRFDVVTSKMKEQIEQSDFWKELTSNLADFNIEYYSNNAYYLLSQEFSAELSVKTFASLLIKTFRKNVLNNRNWPEAPQGGWITPDNWFAAVKDIVRTRLVVKYLDGVEFMLGKMQAICTPKGLSCRIFYEAREEGYYAAHAYLSHNFEIPKPTWDTETIQGYFEIQITTQIQEVI